MALIPNSVSDILKSKTRRGLPHPVDYPKADTSSYVQGADNFHKVMAIKPAITSSCSPIRCSTRACCRRSTG